MNLLDALKNIILSLGYGGIFFAAGLEYACFPISSEILLPLIGYMSAQGNMNLIAVILTSTIAGTLGSLFCYTIGRIGGSFLEQTLCKRFQTLQIGMERAKILFQRHGRLSVLFARMFPIARTYISFPAGMASMSVSLFLTYTAIGAFLWNSILISCGYYMGKNWESATLFYQEHKWAFAVAIALLLFFIAYRIKKRKCKRCSSL
ncbi:MAG: DedA family protein [Epulopiscium sp.]|jgi:membrane protein DedA with SNARE-associated domain|nr:DedA family protein [Candidatus Epulonipiscium sp.]